MNHPLDPILDLINEGALFVANHSGGKDSQAMTNWLLRLVPASQLVVIHAHLPEVEWEGTEHHIRSTIGDAELHIVQAKKTFFEMVEHRKRFPSPSTRQCTSDLKRGPIQVKINAICRERGFTKVVNCMGLRAEESSGRAKKEVFKLNKRASTSKRTQYDWLPIHEMTTAQVFESIKNHGQTPFYTYAQGMKRKSCCFCIMACKSDLQIAARLRPELFSRYVETEKRLGHTMIMPTKKDGKKFLDEIVNK